MTNLSQPGMNLYNVIELPRGEVESLAPLILRQQQAIGSRDFAFFLTLEPEQPPYLDKLKERLEAFSRLASRLRPEGVRCGILVQSLLSHGERGQPFSPAPFQRMVNADGSQLEAVFCPLDPGFQKHVAEGMRRIARVAPDFVLTDDDFRLVHVMPLSKGCFCPLHLRLFNERTGRDFTPETLLARTAEDTPEGAVIRREWHEAEGESLLQLARLIRAALDEVDPAIRAGICATPSLLFFNNALSRTMAGKNRPFVRLAGACYLEATAKLFPYKVDFVLRQRRQLPADTEVLLEADTYPQHRFSMSATTLKAYLATATLLGLDGAKVWIEPIPAEPFGTNTAYVAAYETVRPWLAAVHGFAKTIRWRGISVLQKDDEPYRLPWSVHTGKQLREARWVSVWGRMAFPHLPGGAETGPVRCFDGDSVEGYSREEWLGFLQAGVLLDGDAAERLCRRGLGEYLGVQAATDACLRLSGERYAPAPEWNGTSSGLIRSAIQPKPGALRRLTPISPAAIIAAEYIERPWRQSPEVTPVAPSVTLFQNRLGGRVAIFAAELAQTAALHFINPYRREQLARVLCWLAPEEFPLLVRTDCDLYVLLGETSGNRGWLLYLLNLQADPLPFITLTTPLAPGTCITELTPEGVWTPVPWEPIADGSRIACPLAYLQYRLLRIEPV